MPTTQAERNICIEGCLCGTRRDPRPEEQIRESYGRPRRCLYTGDEHAEPTSTRLRRWLVSFALVGLGFVLGLGWMVVR